MFINVVSPTKRPEHLSRVCQHTHGGQRHTNKTKGWERTESDGQNKQKKRLKLIYVQLIT